MNAAANRILVVDDVPTNLRLLADLLQAHGYAVATAADGEAALAIIAEGATRLVLLDVMMPGIDGIEVLRRVRADPGHDTMPVVMVTALEDRALKLRALETGADDFLNKPIDRHEVLARVRSLLRIRQLYEQTQAMAEELRRFNVELESRVATQVEQLQRLAGLKRFFSPRLAEILVGEQGESLLASHRREIVVVALDLRGFSAFTEQAEPEEVMTALGHYHAAMGARIEAAEGTLERFVGDGIVVLFNDPLPIPDASQKALDMALAMQQDFAKLARTWHARGYSLGLGIGVARGYATLGQIGFAGRIDYAAIGAVNNLASRLCALARHGEILCSRSVLADAEVESQPRGEHSLAGFARPVEVFLVTGSKLASAARTT